MNEKEKQTTIIVFLTLCLIFFTIYLLNKSAYSTDSDKCSDCIELFKAKYDSKRTQNARKIDCATVCK